MENNQTALQSFWNKIALKLSVEQINEFLPEFERAKQIEKEQIEKTYKNGYVVQRVSKKLNNTTTKLMEKVYYKE